MNSAEIEARLQYLRAQRNRLIATINEAREELEKMDYALMVLSSPLGMSIGRKSRLKITKGGSIKNLSETILSTLEETGHVMTASDLRDELYDPALAVTPEQLRRRLSVTTSAMLKKHKVPMLIDSDLKNPKREIYWGLPAWFNEDGKIDLDRVPEHAL